MQTGTKVNLLKEEIILNMSGTSIEENTDVIDNEKWICGVGTKQRPFLGKYIYFKKDYGRYIEDMNGFYWPKELLRDKI